MPKSKHRKKPVTRPDASPCRGSADDIVWNKRVLPAPSFEEGVISIYGDEISNRFIDVLNKGAASLGSNHGSAIDAVMQAALGCGTYLAHVMGEELNMRPADPVEAAASVIAQGFLMSPHNRGTRKFIEPGGAPFGLTGGDVYGSIIDEANRQRAKERFYASCILSGMLLSVGHFAAYASDCDHCLKPEPDRQRLLIRSVMSAMQCQFMLCNDSVTAQ